MQKVEEEGGILMVKEHRDLDGTGTRKDHIVIKGTSESLTMHFGGRAFSSRSKLHKDFLLTCRTFLSSPTEVGKKLLEWFNVPSLRDKVVRVVLLWMNNHFSDFEGDPAMTWFLDKFENNLEREQMGGHLRLLNIACAAKAKRRLMTLSKPTMEAPLHFILLGGSEKGFGIFVDSVDSGSKAAEVGMTRGDQILEVNGQNFQNVQFSKAVEILKNNTHLSITVKTNLFGIDSPQALKKILSLTEEGSLECHKKPAEDEISNASSQLSSPPTSPQSSTVKDGSGSQQRSFGCVQLDLTSSSSSLGIENSSKNKKAPLIHGIDHTLAPSGTVDNYSHSGHSEISSRSSIASNSSFDSVPFLLQRHSVTIVERNLGVGRTERWTMIEPHQYSLG